MARALMSQFSDAENLGLERAADGIQQIGQRRVKGVSFSFVPAIALWPSTLVDIL